jgi:hypothetical protein
MREADAGTTLRHYLRGCAWPCPPDAVRAIAADNGTPFPLLLALELVPVRLYESEEALLKAVVQAALRPTTAHYGAVGVVCPAGLLDPRNGYA